MVDALLQLLDRGAVRDALAAARGDGVSARIVAGWGLAGGGDPKAAVAALRPVVAALEGPAAAGEPEAVAQHAHALLAMGVASVLGGEGEAGTALLERALARHDAAWPRAQCLRFCALALEQRGAWEGAAARYEAAAAVYREIGNDHGLGSALYGAATALAEAGEDARSRALLEEAVAVLRRAGAAASLGAALAQLATLAVAQEADGALGLLDEAEELTRGITGMYAWDVRLRRGEVLLGLGRFEEALGSVEAARALAPADIPDAAWADNLRARALVALGREAEAAESLDAAEAARRGPPGGLSGAALLERAAIRLRLAAGARPVALAAADAALDLVERAVRAKWHRRGVERILAEAAERLAEAEEAGARDRAARAWQLAAAFGAPAPRAELRALRAAGARVPLGPLWLEARIGRGGMGEVWEARHRNGRAVAVKILRRDVGGDHAALFDAEMQAVARLDHPHVVRVLAALPLDPVAAELLLSESEAGAPGGATALVMELVRGGSLEERLAGWRWPEARALLRDLLAALAHAHARGVLHLDLKPANVLIDDVAGGRVPRLTDFGLAGLARHRPEGRVFGTPAYMAPEQGTTGAPLGPWTDLYALGCLAWRLLAGRVPFDAVSPSQQIALHRTAPLPRFLPIHPAPRGLEAWLATLLAKRPEERFACAADAAAALDALGEPEEAPASEPEEAAASPAAETLVPGGFFSGGRSGSASGSVGSAGSAASGAGPGAPDAGPVGPDAGPVRPDAGPVGPDAGSAAEPPDVACAVAAGDASTVAVAVDASGDALVADDSPGGRAAAPTVAREPAPFSPDWRRTLRRDAPPFLSGAGEGLFAWRVGRLVGRERERDLLWDALGRVHADGAARAVWVRGAPGLGRSALLAWLAETALATGAAWVAEPDAPPTRRDRPRLVLLDDPEPSVARAVLDREAGARALVVIASRGPPLPGVAAIGLSPLSDAELHALLDERLPIDRALATTLAARAAGSPAFAVALLTDLVRRDALEPGPEGFRVRADAAIALPDDLRSLWTARLDALAPIGSPRRAAWEIAAVVGARAPAALTGAAWERAGLVPDSGAFLPLEAEGWVARDPVGVTFRVPAVREALLAGAAAAGLLPTWHGVVADVLAADHGDLGRHLAAAGRHAQALRPLRRAAADAVNRTRIEECRALLEAWDRSADALGIAPGDPRRASPIVVRVHLALHTHEDPYPLLDQGLAIARGLEAVQLAYTLGWVLAQDGRHAEAEAAYLRALALPVEDDTLDELRHVIRLGLAVSLYAQGRDADALVDGLRADLAGRDHLLARLDACAGRGALRLGRHAAAEPLLLAAVEGARRIAAPDVEAEAHADLAELRVARGDDPVPCLEAAVAALGATGSDKALRARARLAAALICAGRSADARAALVSVRRFGWRMRPRDAAELAVVEAALEGHPPPPALATLGDPSPPIARLLAFKAWS